MPTTFVSYSWDSEAHREWVLSLATRLREDGIETVVDQWHVVPGDQLPAFMEKAIRDSEYVLIICTARYKGKSDRREGGVGYEGDVITGEVFTERNERKFIPVLREGEWTEAAPSWLKGKYYIDLRGEPYPENHYQDLLTTLLGIRRSAPPVRVAKVAPAVAKRILNESSTVIDTFQPIKIDGVIADQISTPRWDGTRGSALYAIPFRFSQRPPEEWSDLFIQAWDRPSSFTSMHRPGIASVRDDIVVLDGTTIDEVERYHRNTLVLAADTANKNYVQLLAQRRVEQERERERVEAHKTSVNEIADRLKF